MFSRSSRRSGRHARDDRARRGGRTSRSLAEELEVSDELSPPAASPQPAAEPARPASGPYDISEAPPGVTRLDLGSLKIPSVPGVEVRVQANQQGVVQQVYLVSGESALQLGAYAAPRTESIWDEMREELRKALFQEGVAAEEVPGEYGVELRARIRTPQGQLKDLRCVGISGPRWLIRAVYNGPAAVDPAQAGPLAECLRGVVVDRGNEAKPPKEALPLRLSPEMASQIQAQAAQAQAARAQQPPLAGPGTQAPTSPAAPAARTAPATPTTPVNGSSPAGGAAPPRRRPSPRPRRQG